MVLPSSEAEYDGVKSIRLEDRQAYPVDGEDWDKTSLEDARSLYCYSKISCK